MRRLLPTLLIALIPVGSVSAQVPEEPALPTAARIETTGEATLAVPVAYVDVWIYREAEADTLDLAIRACETFATDLEPTLRAEGVQALDVYTEAPVAPDPDATPASAMIRARVRLRLGLQGRTEQGFAELGNRIEMIKRAAGRLGATRYDLKLEPADRAAAEREVVQRATEQAYPLAEAVAEALTTQVYGVDHVEIETVDWPAYTPADLATLDTLLCRAKVRVIYLTLP
jgi:uncharacterized protein YggE